MMTAEVAEIYCKSRRQIETAILKVVVKKKPLKINLQIISSVLVMRLLRGQTQICHKRRLKAEFASVPKAILIVI